MLKRGVLRSNTGARREEQKKWERGQIFKIIFRNLERCMQRQVQQSPNTTIKVNQNLDGLGSASPLVESVPIVPKALASTRGATLARVLPHTCDSSAWEVGARGAKG